MTRLIVGTDGPETSEVLLDYLEATVGDGDAVYVINSHIGGDETAVTEMEAGEAALETLEEGLAATGATVEIHQYVRGNAPAEDLIAAADEFDADEYVIGVRKRTPLGKVVFGSTAQNLLLDAEVPVRCVPLIRD